MEVANSEDGLKFEKAEQPAELLVGGEGDQVVKIDEKGLIAGALEARVGGGSGHAVGLYRPLDSAAEGVITFVETRAETRRSGLRVERAG